MKDIAEASGLTAAQFTKFERGQSEKLKPESLESLLETYGCPEPLRRAARELCGLKGGVPDDGAGDAYAAARHLVFAAGEANLMVKCIRTQGARGLRPAGVADARIGRDAPGVIRRVVEARLAHPPVVGLRGLGGGPPFPEGLPGPGLQRG